jgi:hypothetical protein
MNSDRCAAFEQVRQGDSGRVADSKRWCVLILDAYETDTLFAVQVLFQAAKSWYYRTITNQFARHW